MENAADQAKDAVSCHWFCTAEVHTPRSCESCRSSSGQIYTCGDPVAGKTQSEIADWIESRLVSIVVAVFFAELADLLGLPRCGGGKHTTHPQMYMSCIAILVIRGCRM